MLARRRRRQLEAEKKAKADIYAPANMARALVQEEIHRLQQRLVQARQETQRKRQHYQQQEAALRRHYQHAQQQLEQRRATLLATTSLIPYTQTIQAASQWRVPAPIVTLQARLCLHVHCLCLHEELLLRTKEQGWDTIAWMEDVSRQLRLLTHKQVALLHGKLRDQYEELQAICPTAEIPEDIQQSLQQFSHPTNHETNGHSHPHQSSSDSDLLPDTTPSSGELLDEPVYIGHGDYYGPPQRRHDESFTEFLQRYQQRKLHQRNKEQMRLAEFRTTGTTHLRLPPHQKSSTTSQEYKEGQNPYTSRRARVGQQLRQYATKLFQGNDDNDIDDDGRDNHKNTMLDDIQSEHIASTRTSSDHTVGQTASGGGLTSNLQKPRQWISAVKQRSTSLLLLNNNYPSSLSDHQSSELDASNSSWSLGGSLRGLRTRGLGRRRRHNHRNSNSSNNNHNTNTMAVAELSHGESSSSSDDDDDNDNDNDNDDNEQEQNQNGTKQHKQYQDDMEDSFSHDDVPVPLEQDPNNDNNHKKESDDSNAHETANGDPGIHQTLPSTTTSSPLKNKLQAPIVQKYHESAKW